MSYVKNPTWQDGAAGGTLITAATLNHLEDGVEATAAAADAATAALPGKAPIAHNHDAADVTTGTLATARLGSGTADATTFLRGDRTWATPPAGGGGGAAGAPPGYQKLAAATCVRMYDANRVDGNSFSTLNRLTFAPFWMGVSGNLLRHFIVNIGTAGAAGSVVRVGIYAAGADGRPAALVKDAGVIPATSTGDAIGSLPAGQEVNLAPGLYFLAGVIQVVACTVARYVSSFSPFGSGIYGEGISNYGSGAAGNSTIPWQDGVTGALPASATIGGLSNLGIYVAGRVQ